MQSLWERKITMLQMFINFSGCIFVFMTIQMGEKKKTKKNQNLSQSDNFTINQTNIAINCK